MSGNPGTEISHCEGAGACWGGIGNNVSRSTHGKGAEISRDTVFSVMDREEGST